MDYVSTYRKSAYYRLSVAFEPSYKEEALRFIKFLQNVGQKHELKLRYRSKGSGRIDLIVAREQGGNLDTLLQELVLSRGLHYYAAALEYPKRDAIIEEVVLPMYEGLLKGRFLIPTQSISVSISWLKSHLVNMCQEIWIMSSQKTLRLCIANGL